MSNITQFQNEIKHIKNSLNRLKYANIKNFYANIGISFSNNTIEFVPEIEVDFTDTEIEDFKYSHFQIFDDIVNNELKKYNFILNFAEEPECDGYLNSPIIDIYNDNYDYDNAGFSQKIPYTPQELKSLDFITSKNSRIYSTLSFYFNENNNIETEVDISFTDNNPLFDLISHSSTYYEILTRYLENNDKNPIQLPIKFIDSETIEPVNLTDDLISALNELDEKKTFDKFIENSILKDEEIYIWISTYLEKNISEGLIIEHIGYNFNWNNYNKLDKKINFNILHSYQDLSWKPAMVSNREKESNLTGVSKRDLLLGNDSYFKDNLFKLTKECLSSNIFRDSYSKFKMVVNKGLIISHKIIEGCLYGLNENGEVILFISCENSHKNELPIIDIDLFIEKLNTLIKELI